MAALNDLAPKYGGTTKIDEVKALWEAGVLTSQIPEDLLVDYLVGTPEEDRNGGDIRNTELVFLGQIQKAVAQGQLKMIQDRMDGLCATTEMEFNGLKIDVAEAGRRLKVLTADLAKQDEELNGFIPADCPFDFNWSSRVHASCLIFGGTVKYQKQAPYLDEATGELARKQETETHFLLLDGTTTDLAPDDNSKSLYATFVSGKRKGEYKTKQVKVLGEIKVKYQDFFYSFPRLTEPNEKWATKNTDGYDAPIYSTSGDIIVELALRNIPFVKALRSKQKLEKEIGTYYAKQDAKGEWSGMLTCVQKHDHMIHHKLNHTSTVTSRLSSSDPNGQNLPRGDKSEVKAQFVSRFTEAYCKVHGIPCETDNDGEMVEADYSQLEVVVQGVLTGDAQLCQDLRDRVDFHCKRVAAKFAATASHITYEYALDWCKNEDHADYKAGKKERTKCKIFSFQRAYGAGAATIAEETGMSLEETQALMQAEDELYPGVVAFNAAVESAVIKSAEPFSALGDDGKWKTYRRGYWQAPTGTLYTWRSYDAPEYARKRGKLDTFNPPEMKNYPVQGTGGEFVQCTGGRLWRHFVANDNYGGRAFLVNTVHDCNWADIHKSVRDQVCADMKRIMESIPEIYNERYGMNITVPFPVEVEYGPNMNKLHHWVAAA
ncbi:DNA polymerase [Bradyrhizobium sp. LTSP885]|uniref:DNA polymerase n=1 Tax=Bradyrhizobium sp. LTSP885 TaxID=1619232 RepID=UPI0018CCDB11|nr:DNA polymerase [Bradyrhizobium sp. LTSP885]